MSTVELKITEILALLAEKYSYAQLAVVTKSRNVEEMMQALDAGAQIIAENRTQEAREKFAKLANETSFRNAKKHFIGNLQGNKVKDAVALFDVIQSVDSVKLAEKINEEAAKIGKQMPVLLQVNISLDANKSGFLQTEIFAAVDSLSQLKNISIQGLMTITQNYNDPTQTKRDFLAMKALFDTFCLKLNIKNGILSMGMSNDYLLALECGSNLIRVGTAIFEN